MRIPSRLLVVTDRQVGHEAFCMRLRAALEAGARWVWFRERDMEPEARLALGETVATLVRHAGGVLTVGGDPVLAAHLGADGVHLPAHSGEEAVARARGLLPEAAVVGISAHSVPEVGAAARAGADYVTLSPIFETESKPGYGPALGLEGLGEAARTGLPVLALGGVAPAVARACLDAGASGIAVMGGLMRAEKPEAVARRYRAAIERHVPTD